MPDRLSVVIPTFNDAATLPQTVASVLAQRRPPDEIVIVNDAGADPSQCLAGLQGAMADRVRILHQSRNLGASAARNAGLASTTGELIHFLDSDDVIGPDFLERASDALSDHPMAAYAISDGIRAQEPAFLGAVSHLSTKQPTGRTTFLDSPAQFAHVAAHPGFYLLSFTLWRRDKLQWSSKDEWLDTRLETDEDFQMYLRTALRQGAVRLEDVMGVHRLRSGSLSKNARRVWANRTKAMDFLLAEDEFLASRPEARARIGALRGNGARRLAKVLAAAGNKVQARATLVEDLSKFAGAANWVKSAVLYLRMFA